MLTDAPPRKVSHHAGFLESDRIKTLDLPQDGRLLTIAQSVESAVKAGTTAGVRRACAEFLDAASEFYRVPACGIRVLSSRPLRVRENWSTELFGDYTPETMLIRVWMRTAVRKEVTSFGTFLSKLCHEFMAHTWILRASRRAISHCSGHAAKATVLGISSGQPLANRLAAHESRCVNQRHTKVGSCQCAYESECGDHRLHGTHCSIRLDLNTADTDTTSSS